MVKLSVVIMGHPKRMEMIEKHRKILDDDRVKLSIDYDSKGVWWNSQRSWRMYDEEATHHLVMQDDVQPCENFIAGAEEAIDYNWNNIISFFNVYKKADEAVERGDSWFTTAKVWGQAIVLPTHWIEPYLEWSEEYIREGYKHDDVRLTVFGMVNNKRIWQTVPSLVEHKCPKDSLLGNNPPITRTARHLIADDKDPAKLDWTKPRNPLYLGTSIEQYKSAIKPNKWAEIKRAKRRR